MKPSSPNGANGRDQHGRFAPGNAGGPGNPHAQQVAKLRAALLDAVTEDDLREIVAALVQAAKMGDTAAAREVLDRTIGKPVQTDLLQRVEELEQRVVVYVPDNGRGPISGRERLA